MDTKTLKSRKKIALFVTWTLFFLSLITKVYEMDNGSIKAYGYEAFFAGWMELFGIGISWLANPISVLAIIFFMSNKIKLSLVLSFVALLFALAFFIYTRLGETEITAIGIGYYLWAASIFAVFVSSIQLLRYVKVS